MKILNNRYIIIKELPLEVKNDAAFIVKDLISDKDELIELRLIYASNMDEDFMQFIRDKFILIKQLKETAHIKNYDFTRLISIDDKTVNEDIYLYTIEYIEKKEPIFNFLIDAKTDEIFELFAAILKELNYLITYGIVCNNLDLNNIYVIRDKDRVFLKIKDIVSEKNQYSDQIRFLTDSEVRTFVYNYDIVKTTILSLLLKKNIIRNHEKYFQELQQIKIDKLDNENKKNLYTCFFKIYDKINARKAKKTAYPFYEIISDVNYNINTDYTISTPISIEKKCLFPINREKEKEEIFSIFKETKSSKAENKNILITGAFGVGKTLFLYELYFLLLLERLDIFYIPGIGDMNDITFILYLMKSLFLKSSLIQKNHEKELNTILDTLKSEMEVNEDIAKISALKYKLVNLITKLMIENASSQSIVFIIDDIHLINEFITKTILYIAIENSDKKNIILIQSVNESLVNNNHYAKKLIKTLSNESSIKKINLQSLSELDTEALIRNTINIKNIPEVLLKKIYLNTSGNPLFINEALKELIISGDLEKDNLNESCKLSTNLSNPSIPIPISANIQQAVKRQIKNLDKSELTFLKDLCIFKFSFRIQALPEILNATDTIIQKSIPRLLDQNIIKKTTKPSADEYVIVNKILQKTLYDELDYHYRIQIHKKIIQKMKKLKIFDIYEFIYHAEKAELFDEAVNYCIKYKNKIKEECTPIAYIDIFEKIYTFIPNDDNDKKLEILLILAESYLGNDNLIECTRRIEEAEKIMLKSSENKIYTAKIYIIKAIQGIQSKSNPEKIARSLALAEKAAAAVDDTYTQLSFDKAHIAFLQYKNNYAEAIDEAKKTILKCGNFKEFTFIKTKVLLDLANNLFYSGQYKEAEKAYLEALKKAKEISDTNIQDTIFNNLAIIQDEIYNNFDEAIAYYTKILKNNNITGNVVSQIMASLNLSIIYSHFHDYENAYIICNQVIKKIIQYSYNSEMFFAHTFMHDIFLSMCMYDKAAEIEMQIKKILKNKNIPKAPSDINIFNQTRAVFYYGMGDFEAAKEAQEENINYKNNITDIISVFPSLFINLNKIAQGKMNSTEEVEAILIKIISNPIFLDNIYLVFYEMIYCLRKIIIFRHDIDFRKIIKMVLEIKCSNDSTLMKAPLLFLEAYMDPKNAEKKLIEAASLIENKYVLDLSIDINIKLGLIYLENNNISMAMINFAEAQKLIDIFIKKVPLKFKKTYFSAHHYGLPSLIICDYIKKDMKSDYKKFIDALSYEQTKRLLLKNNIEKLKNNPAFILNIIAQTKQSGLFKNKSIDDIIEKFTDDFLQNIKILLNFTALNLLANSADVFVTANDGKIKSLFNFGKNKAIEKIAQLIEASTYKMANIKADSGVSSHLVIPINYHCNKQTGNTVTGYLVFVSNKEINNFGNFGISFCLSIENTFAFLIESYKAQQEAATDKLTSALTRKYTEDALSDLLTASKMKNSVFSILMYDLDKFKKINDTFGHQIGDTVLKAVANTVLSVLKKGQILGRVGGEEFIVLLPDVEKEQALIIAEKIRKQVEALLFDDPDVRITISIGIAVFPRHGSMEKDLLSKVDQALYAAKNRGRNQVVVWKESLEPGKKKADRLAGILTGNSLSDTKNILSFIDTVSFIRSSISKINKLEICLEKIIDAVGADSGIFVYPIKKKISKNIFKYTPVTKPDFPVNKNFIAEVISEKKELCKIDWENISGKSDITGIPTWNSAILVPIILKGEIKALIYLVVEIRKKEFGIEDLNLVNLFAGLIAPFF